MTPIEMSAAVQRLIAGVVARDDEVSDEKLAAKVKEEIGDISPDETNALTTQFRILKARAVKELPHMRWGASMTLDDIKVARFAFDAAREYQNLDEIAVRKLLQETWGHMYGR